VTYRRLLITAKGCTPRDFWVKWTRLDSSVAYSVNDNVGANDIKFEIGEDVLHKIREKEYRFLVGGNADRYRVAMGRKNVTEWRELIKRAIKRGELEKTTSELESRIHSTAVADKLSEVLEKCGFDLSQIVSATAAPASTDAVDEALRAVAFGPESETENQVYAADSEIKAEDEVILDENNDSETALELSEADASDEEEVRNEDKNKDEEFAALTEWFADVQAPSEDSLTEINEDDVAEIAEKILHTEDKDIEEADPEVTEDEVLTEEESSVADTVITMPDDEEMVVENEITAEQTEQMSAYNSELVAELQARLDEARMLAEAERAARLALDNTVSGLNLEIEEHLGNIAMLEAKVRELTSENVEAVRSRDLATAELERMRIDYDKMALENEKCKEAVKASEELRLAAEKARREQEKKLIEQLELQEKERTREKMLFAEAARQAKEENDRMASELAAAEAARLAEEEKALAERRREEEKARREAALAAEKERIENEVRRRMEQKEAIHESAISRALETMRKFEEAARINAESRITATSEYVTVVPADSENTKVTEAEKISVTEPADAVKEESTNTQKDISVEDAEDSVVEACEELVAEEDEVLTEPVSNDDVKDEEFNSLYDDEPTEPIYAPTQAYVPVQEPYKDCTYMTKKARLIFLKTLDPNMLATVRDMLEEALTKFGKQNVFIKIKASIEDGNIMILNFVKIPDHEMQLLNDLLRYLGNGGIGITKILVE